MKTLSIVVPLCNERSLLLSFYQNMIKDLKQLPINYECIFIDNGSRDKSLSTLRELCDKDFHFHYISMKHNMSLIEALYMGIQYAQGDFILIMNVQHPTYMISNLYNIMLDKQATNIGGKLIISDATTKQQKYFRIFMVDEFSAYFEEKDFDGFKKHLNQSQDHTLWVPYTNLEENNSSLIQHIIMTLNIKYDRNLIYITFVLCVIIMIILPLILILHFHLDIAYCFYISILFTICIFVIMTLIHARYCCAHIVNNSKKIRETTFH